MEDGSMRTRCVIVAMGVERHLVHKHVMRNHVRPGPDLHDAQTAQLGVRLIACHSSNRDGLTQIAWPGVARDVQDSFDSRQAFAELDFPAEVG